MEPTTATTATTTEAVKAATDNVKPAPRNRVKAPAKPRAAKAPTAKQKAEAAKADADAKAAEAAKPAPESPEGKAQKILSHLTHRENCVMVTLGGNKVGWTSKDHRPFHFGTTEGTWEAEALEAMANYGIAPVKTGPRVLASLKAKGLLDAGSPNEDGQTWWRVTTVGQAVSVALNNKVWK
jgi:hypothetical protein